MLMDPKTARHLTTDESQILSPVPSISGVNVRYLETHSDERGELCEAYRISWNLHPAPLVMVTFVTIRPGEIRGWVVHQLQDDRVFIGCGCAKIVLFDARQGSETKGCVSTLYFDDTRRGTFTIPAGVYHAFQNVGSSDVVFIDMPSRPYDPQNPDTYRLPLENDVIPFRWS